MTHHRGQKIKALQWGKKASLFAANQYLRRNHQQLSEEKSLPP